MREPPSKKVPVRTANDRWKGRRRLRVACSIALAVVLHAAVFVLWPAGEVEEPGTDSPLNALELLQVAQSSAERNGSSSDVVPVPAAPVVQAGDSAGSEGEAENEDEGDGRSDGAEARIAGMSDSLFDRIRDRAPRPTLTEPEPEAREEDPAASDDELLAGSETPSAADVPNMLELSELELERLSEVRPELALTAPSGWVTVRNPTDVRRFMKRIYNRGVMDPDASGSVSVALWIDEKGSVEWAEITDSSGREAMDRVALDLFREVVTFWPAREEGAPVPTSAIFSVVFPWP